MKIPSVPMRQQSKGGIKIMIETIKSYLVSLGFHVDKQSFNEVNKVMEGADKAVLKFAGGAVKEFATAAVAVEAFVAAAVVGIAKFVGDLAQADLANEKLARQMWTSKDNAAAFNNTLKAMGASLQDLYLSPELMRNFQTLRDQASNMRPPAEFNDQMKMIRSIQFEFTRLKLEATYALQWIGYYFVKYMGGPIKDIKLTLKEINDVIIKTMPSWTKVVAQVMSWFGQMGVTTVRAVKDVIRVFDDIGRGIPKNMKLIGAAVAALGLIISSGPIGMIMAAIGGIILLLDDFYTYLNGGDSMFGPFWAKLQNVFKDLKQGVNDFWDTLKGNGTIESFEKGFSNTFEVIRKLFAGAKVWVQGLYEELKKQGVLSDLKISFENVIESVGNLFEAVTGLINKVLGFDGTKTGFTTLGKFLNDVIIVSLRTINGLLESIAGYTNGLASIFDGTIMDKMSKSGQEAQKRLEATLDPDEGFWGSMWQTFKDMMTDSFTGGTGFSDRVRRSMGWISDDLSGRSPGYILPGSTSTTNKNNVTMSPTYNIYGSDPQATADAANSKNEWMLNRNFRGLIR
jgi:hypothetical protein